MTDTLTLDALVEEMSRETRRAEQDYRIHASLIGAFDPNELHAAMNRAALAAVAKAAGGKDALLGLAGDMEHLAAETRAFWEGNTTSTADDDRALSDQQDRVATLLRTLAEAAP